MKISAPVFFWVLSLVVQFIFFCVIVTSLFKLFS